MPDAILQTGRLRLRRFQAADTPGWLAHMNTPAVCAHLGGVKTDDEVAARIARVRSLWNDETGGYLAIVRRDDGLFLGECGCSIITTPAAPDGLRGGMELGWQLRADQWGHGYASEAAAAVLGLVFGRFGQAQAFAQTSEANRGSWRVMERLGMERAAHLDYDDPEFPPEENPTKVYRIGCAQWERARA